MPRDRVGIAAVLKDEGPYLLEWIAHYRLLGVSRFFLADNGGRDNTSDLLTRLDTAGVVTRIPFPTPAGGTMQMTAYAAIHQSFGEAVDWMAFLDGDEFVMLNPPHRDLPGMLADVAGDVDAIGLNWAVYGSSGLAVSDGRPVMERLVYRAEQAWPTNRHIKTIARPAAFSGMINPHYVALKSGGRAVSSDGKPIVMTEIGGITTQVIWEAARINHYVVKSRAEFEVKRTRGRADSPYPREESFFAEHDRNEVLDPAPVETVLSIRTEVKRLRRLIGLPPR